MDSRCSSYGDSVGSRPICGIDGKDYPNMCELHKSSCLANRRIDVKFQGACGKFLVQFFTNQLSGWAVSSIIKLGNKQDICFYSNQILAPWLNAYPHPFAFWTRRGNPIAVAAIAVRRISSLFADRTDGVIVPSVTYSRKLAVPSANYESFIRVSVNPVRKYPPEDFRSRLLVIIL